MISISRYGSAQTLERIFNFVKWFESAKQGGLVSPGLENMYNSMIHPEISKSIDDFKRIKKCSEEDSEWCETFSALVEAEALQEYVSGSDGMDNADWTRKGDAIIAGVIYFGSKNQWDKLFPLLFRYEINNIFYIYRIDQRILKMTTNIYKLFQLMKHSPRLKARMNAALNEEPFVDKLNNMQQLIHQNEQMLSE